MKSSSRVNEAIYSIIFDSFFLDVDASKAATALSDGFSTAISQFDFVRKNAGGTNGKGSRKFADSFVEELQHCLDDVDVTPLAEAVPNIETAVYSIQSKVDKVVELLIDMGKTNSDAHVQEMNDLSGQAIEEISIVSDALLGNPDALIHLHNWFMKKHSLFQ